MKKSVEKKKFNIKDRLDDDYLDLSLCELDTVPLKEIVNPNLTILKWLNNLTFI